MFGTLSLYCAFIQLIHSHLDVDFCRLLINFDRKLQQTVLILNHTFRMNNLMKDHDRFRYQ